MPKAACPRSFESLLPMNVSWRFNSMCPGIFSFSPCWTWDGWGLCHLTECLLACYYLIAAAMGLFNHSLAAPATTADGVHGRFVLTPHLHSQDLSAVEHVVVGQPPPTTLQAKAWCHSRLREEPRHARTLRGLWRQPYKFLLVPQAGAKTPARYERREFAAAVWLEEGKGRERENSNELISCSKTFSPLCSCFWYKGRTLSPCCTDPALQTTALL